MPAQHRGLPRPRRACDPLRDFFLFSFLNALRVMPRSLERGFLPVVRPAGALLWRSPRSTRPAAPVLAISAGALTAPRLRCPFCQAWPSGRHCVRLVCRGAPPPPQRRGYFVARAWPVAGISMVGRGDRWNACPPPLVEMGLRPHALSYAALEGTFAPRSYPTHSHPPFGR